MTSTFREFLNKHGRQVRKKDDAMTHTYNQQTCLIIATQQEYLLMLGEMKKDYAHKIFHCVSECIRPSIVKPALAIYRRVPDAFFLFADIDLQDGDPLKYEDHLAIGKVFVDTLNLFLSQRKLSDPKEEEMAVYFVYLSQKVDAIYVPPNQKPAATKIKQIVPDEAPLKYSNLHIQTKIEVSCEEARKFATGFIYMLQLHLPRDARYKKWSEIVDLNCYQPQKVNLRMNLCTNWLRCKECAHLRGGGDGGNMNNKKLSTDSFDDEVLIPIQKSVHFSKKRTNKSHNNNNNNNNNIIICPRSDSCIGGYPGDTFYRVGIVLDQNKEVVDEELKRLREDANDEWLATAIRYYFTVDELSTFLENSTLTLPLPPYYQRLKWTMKPQSIPEISLNQQTFVTANGQVVRNAVFSNETEQSQTDLAKHSRQFKKNWDQLPVITSEDPIFDGFYQFLQTANNGTWRGCDIYSIKYIEREHGHREYHVTPCGNNANYCLNKVGFQHKKNTVRFVFRVLGMRQYCLHMNKTGSNRQDGKPCKDFQSDPFLLPQALQRLAFWRFERSLKEQQEHQQEQKPESDEKKEETTMDQLIKLSREKLSLTTPSRPFKPPSQYQKSRALEYLKSRASNS